MSDTKPTVDMPLDEALQDLTGFEVLGIESHYGQHLERLSGSQALIGAVWAYENRGAKTAWNVIEKMTVRELGGYFGARDPGPDSDQGKGSSTGESPPND